MHFFVKPSFDESRASSRWQLNSAPGTREELRLKVAAVLPSLSRTLAESDLQSDSSLQIKRMMIIVKTSRFLDVAF